MDDILAKAQSALDAGRYAEALSWCDRAIAIDPNNENAWYGKGLALLNLNRAEASISCFNKVIEINPASITAWSSKGMAFSKLGRLKQAEKCYEKGKELEKNRTNRPAMELPPEFES